MSTATKKRWLTSDLISNLTMSPSTCRMILVDVLKQEDGSHFVNWYNVLGFICEVSRGYSKEDTGRGGKAGIDHADMEERGWRWDGHAFRLVYPVIWDHGDMDGMERGAQVWDHPEQTANRVSWTVVPSPWPQEEDRANAIRIGNGLLSGDFLDQNCAKLDPPHGQA